MRRVLAAMAFVAAVTNGLGCRIPVVSYFPGPAARRKQDSGQRMDVAARAPPRSAPPAPAAPTPVASVPVASAPVGSTPVASAPIPPGPMPPPRVQVQVQVEDTRETRDDEIARLLDQAGVALEHLVEGSLLAARQEIDQLDVQFPGNRTAKALQTLLRRKLVRMLGPGREAKAASSRDPNAAHRQLVEAQTLLKEGRDDAARSALERGYSHDPDNADVTECLVVLLKRMGLELYSKGDSAQALVHWQRVLEIRPGEPETLRFVERAHSVIRKM